MFLRTSRATSSRSISCWSFCIFFISVHPDVLVYLEFFSFDLSPYLFTLSSCFKIFSWSVAKLKPIYSKIRSLRFLFPNLCLYNVVLHTNRSVTETSYMLPLLLLMLPGIFYSVLFHCIKKRMLIKTKLISCTKMGCSQQSGALS